MSEKPSVELAEKIHVSGSNLQHPPTSLSRRNPILWLFICLSLALLTGIALYLIFDHFKPVGVHASGLMRASFLFGAPLVIGLIIGCSDFGEKGIHPVFTFAIISGCIALFMFIVWSILGEGIICIIMMIPIFSILALIGVLLTSIIKKIIGDNSSKVLLGIGFMPLALMPLEDGIEQNVRLQRIERSIEIQASPQTVWQHINYPLNIQPKELQQGWAYKIGVPFPIEARTIEEKLGGRRKLKWERGVEFEEVITQWEPNQKIAWKYEFQPNSFPAGSLDDHIVIGGRYFQLQDTSYNLTPLPNGKTRLSISVGTSIQTNFNWYAEPWAHFLIGDTAEVILAFYKARSE